MSKSVSLEMNDIALYVPFRGTDRAYGPVGTIDVDASGVGDASGGTFTIFVTMPFELFGFHVMLVLTQVVTEDNLATAERVGFSFRPTGNERVRAEHQEVVLALRSQSANWASFPQLGVPVEGEGAGTAVLGAHWQTNTDTKVYSL